VPSVQYTGYETAIELPDVSEEIEALIGELPDIEKVSAELITEWEFPKLIPNTGNRPDDADAFAQAGGHF